VYQKTTLKPPKKIRHYRQEFVGVNFVNKSQLGAFRASTVYFAKTIQQMYYEFLLFMQLKFRSHDIGSSSKTLNINKRISSFRL